MGNEWKGVPLPDGSYSDDARSWTHQDLFNLIAVNAEGAGTRSPVILRSLPGLQEFAAVPSVTRQRGARNVEGRLYFVAGTSLCQLLPSGAVAILGTIPGTGRVSLSHNQILNGNQLFIATGNAAYVWNTVTSTLTQVTDTGFLGGLLAEFIGSRFLSVDPARRLWQNSELADGLAWNSSEFYTGESSPDRIRAIKEINNEIVLLSEGTIEHFAYTGTTNALFENKGIKLDRGCAATHAVSVMDNALYFLGNDGSVYEKRGYELRRISTHAIEQAMGRHDLSKAYSFVWEDQGHKVVYFTFPNADEAGTWGFDAATRKWHRRGSYGMDRWRLAWLEKWDNGDGPAWYGGEYNTGRVFRLDWDYPLEGADCLPREFSSGVLHKDGNRATMHASRVEYERGPDVAATSVETTLIFDETQVTVGGLTIGGSLPDCAVGDAINYRYATIGGLSPITFAITSGALPAGLTFDTSTGAITGTTTTAEHDNAWTVVATDANGATATLNDTCYVLDMLGDPPDSAGLAAYSYSLTGTEGTAPYTFALTSGALPPGLSLASSGLISGTTGATSAEYAITVTMTDALGVDTVKAYTILVALVPIYMIVGEDGGIAVSADAETWTTKTSGTSETLLCVTYGEGLYVVCGSNGKVVTSPDTTTWTSRTSATGENIVAIAYGSGVFVGVTAVGGIADAPVVYSTDGINWSLATIPSGAGSFGDVIYGNGQFVALSSAGGVYALTSPDGVTWTAHTGGATYAAMWTGTQYVSVGNSAATYTSPTAATWTFVSAQGGVDYLFLGVMTASGVWVAVANGSFPYAGIYTSSNGGVTWARVGALGALMSCCATAGGLHLAAGGTIPSVYSSSDAVTWTPHTTPFGAEGIFAGLI